MKSRVRLSIPQPSHLLLARDCISFFLEVDDEEDKAYEYSKKIIILGADDEERDGEVPRFSWRKLWLLTGCLFEISKSPRHRPRYRPPHRCIGIGICIGVRSQGALKEEDQFQHQLLPFTIATAEAPPSFHTSNLFNSSNTVQETTTIELSETSEQHHQQPCDLLSLQAKKYSDIIILNDQSSETISNEPIKWMSSKMRLMRKMMSQEQITMNKPRGKLESLLNTQIKSENITPSGSVIRACSVCNTTKTPLWRSGPQGPKSLCNACGIRQMKARRAAATSTIQNKDMIIKNEKKFNVDRTIPYKKRYKFSDHEKLKFGESPFGLRESSSTIFHPAFPQDEKDAALLLMTLSFG